MAKLFLTSIDLNKNELLNGVIQNLAAHPASPVSGQLYYNTTDNVIYVWNGTIWVDYSGDIRDVQGTLPITVNVLNGIATVDINNATGTTDGAMSAADKTKFDASTEINTPSTLVERDVNGDFSANRITVNDITITNVPSAGTDGTNKSYVDGLVDGSLKQPEAYDPTLSGNYPITYGGNPVQAGDSFRITAVQTGIGDGNRDVNVEDLLIALVDSPSSTVSTDWMVAESNRDQATETSRGVARLATQGETNIGTDNLTIITPLKLATYLANISVTVKYITTFVGTGAAQTVTITHNLNSQDVIVSIRDANTNEQVEADIICTGVNTLTISGIAVNGRTYNVTVIG